MSDFLTITLNDDAVLYQRIMRFNSADLIREICRCRSKDRPTWMWYRDILIQAHLNNLIRIHGHSAENPFWWRSFDESIEVLSEQVRQALVET